MTGDCIVCGAPTSNKVRRGGSHGVRPYSHFRCPPEERDQCADRRDMKRKRPRHRDAGLDLALTALCTQPRDQERDRG